MVNQRVALLNQRVQEMEQRLNILKSKEVLMADRLSEHKKEQALRLTLTAVE